MPFKFNDDGTLAFDADKKLPIFVHADGRELPFDADNTLATITRLNGEAKGHREAKEAIEAKYKPFEGIEDAEAARAALATVKNLSSGDLKTAAQVQEIKDAAAKSAQEAVAAATRSAEEKHRALEKDNAKLSGQLNDHIIGGSFTGSKYISEKLAIPADIARAAFGHRFKVENGKLVGLDQNGGPIYSATNHGNHADFEEAIQVMVSQYPNRDAILKGSGASGSGAQSGGNGGGGGKTMPRAQFNALAPQARMDAIKGGTTVTD